MKHLLLSTIIAGCMSIGAFAQNVQTEASSVNFEISNMVVNTIEGSFSGMTGTVAFNPRRLRKASINVCVDANTVDTDNAKRDGHLRTADFFDTETYPTICFVSTDISKVNGEYLAKGTLSMHGVTRNVDVPLTYEDGTLTAKLTMNRLDYKIGVETGTAMVGNEVELTIVCVIN